MALPLLLWKTSKKKGGGLPPYLFYDTFTDADGVALAAHVPDVRPGSAMWTLGSAGTWTIQSNRLAVVANTVRQATIDTGTANVYVTFSGQCPAGWAASFAIGACIRYTDASNFWWIDWYYATGLMRIIERKALVDTLRASAVVPFAGGVDHTFDVTCNGTTITYQLDNNAPLTYSSATFNQTATKHGIVVYASLANQVTLTFDDFTVMAL